MKERTLYIILFLLTGLVYLLGMIFLDIMDIDASLYAEMSRELLDSGDWLTFRNRIIDLYLDKPPLLFWLSATSYSLFGVSAFAYRLPTFLSTLLGIYATYRFSRLYYSERTSILASLLLFTCQAWFLINHDVRTDTLLANFVIFGSWQLAEFFTKRKFTFVIGAFAGFGLAMLSKGPIGLMVPVMAFGTHILYTRRFKLIFRWEWLAGLAVLIIVISPALISLYRQYGSFGVEFYLWIQSFGRITGQNYWKEETDSLFFVHTFLWSFLPWSFIAVYALFDNFARLIRNRFRAEMPEVITIAGFTLTFLMVSMSSYKLPHYIYVVFPFAAVFSAESINRTMGCNSFSHKFFRISTYIIGSILLVGIMTILPVSFDINLVIYFIFVIIAISLVIYLIKSSSASPKWLIFGFITIILSNFFINIFFYPSLQKYHSGKAIASAVSELNIAENSLFLLDVHSSNMDFHMRSTPPEVNIEKIRRLSEYNKPVYIISSESGKLLMGESDISFEVLRTFNHYNTQILTLRFLNPQTRGGVLQKRHLIEVSQQSAVSSQQSAESIQ